MKSNAKLLLCIFVAAFFISGCAVIRPMGGKSAIECPSPVKTFVAGVTVKGKSIKYTKFGAGANTTLLISSIHGDEQAGSLLLNRFRSFLKENRNLLCGKTVIIIPIVNPDGFVRKTRFNADKIDLNRNFPSDNRINDEKNGAFALSEPEAYALYRILNIFKPNKIFTIHETLGCIDYDGPAENIAGQLALKCKLPVRKVGAKPGSFGSYAGQTLNIPIITIELSDEDSKKNAKKLWDDYKDMLIEAISL